MSMGQWFSSRAISSPGIAASHAGGDINTKEESAAGLSSSSHETCPANEVGAAERYSGVAVSDTPEGAAQSDVAGKGDGKDVDDKKATSFQSFMERLQQAKDLKRHVLVRIAHINKLPETSSPVPAHNADTTGSEISPEEQERRSGGVQHEGGCRSRMQEQAAALIEDLQRRVRAHPLWSAASQDELDTADEAIEKLVTLKLYHRLFGALGRERALDAQLRHRIECLQFLQPQHFDISDQVWSSSSSQSCFEVARRELCKMNNYKSPKDKVVCIFNCCKLAARVLALTSESSTGADELLPLLILLLLRANPAALHSNLAFITNCRHHSRLNGEQGYFLTTISSASEFLLNVCSNDGELTHEGALSIDASEFQRRFRERREALADNLAPESLTESSAPREEGDLHQRGGVEGGSVVLLQQQEQVGRHDGASSCAGGTDDAQDVGGNALLLPPHDHRASEQAGASSAAAAASGGEHEEGSSTAVAVSTNCRTRTDASQAEGDGEATDKVLSARIERMRALSAAGTLHTHPAFAYEGTAAASVADVADLLAQYQELAATVRALLEPSN